MSLDRIIVAGHSGSGKTTLARRLAERLDLPRAELDALFHGPGWVERPEFSDDVHAFTAGRRWVCEAQYERRIGTHLWDNADLVVWLDYGRARVMGRLLRRSVHRALDRAPLYNGNRERVRGWVAASHPIRWTWTHFAQKQVEIGQLIDARPALVVVHVREPADLDRWLATLPGSLRP